MQEQRNFFFNDGGDNNPTDWSRDGRFLLFTRTQGQTSGLWLLPILDKEHKPVKYLETQFRLRGGSFSPDGRWVMYTSNVSGHEEVYVSPFPDAAASPAVLVSTDGGDHPHWRRDGKAIYYLSPDLKLAEVDVLPGSAFKVGVPKALFQTHVRQLGDPAGWLWDVSPDGKRVPVQSRCGSAERPAADCGHQLAVEVEAVISSPPAAPSSIAKNLIDYNYFSR